MRQQVEAKKIEKNNQNKLKNMINKYCRLLFAQSDKEIIKRYPDLAYLVSDDHKTQTNLPVVQNSS